MNINMKCLNCNKEFKPKRSFQKFCHRKCTSIYNNAKSPEKKLNLKSEFSVFNRDNFSCIYCGKSSIEDSVKLTLDHVIPLSKSGKSDINNIITACKRCNSSKQNKRLDTEIEEKVLNVIKDRNLLLCSSDSELITERIKELIKQDEYRLKNYSL